jgi:IclR family transcriptional regulator, pca regulon regulatory protein
MRKTTPAARAEGEPRNKDFVATLGKGLEVLGCFGRQHGRLTVSEAALLCGSTPASARRSLLTLQALGYLDSDGKRFWMEPKVLLIAQAYLASRPMPSLAQPLLDALSERTRESASLGLLQDDDAIIVARSTARRSLSTGLGIGSRLPAYCSALGRVLLASLGPEEAARRVRKMARRKLTPRTVADADGVLQLLAQCRQRGFSGNDGELEIGVRSMAVPVIDRSGQVVAAMSIAVRAERMKLAELQDAFLAPLQRASQSLTRRLYAV